MNNLKTSFFRTKFVKLGQKNIDSLGNTSTIASSGTWDGCEIAWGQGPTLSGQNKAQKYQVMLS